MVQTQEYHLIALLQQDNRRSKTGDSDGDKQGSIGSKLSSVTDIGNALLCQKTKQRKLGWRKARVNWTQNVSANH
jgi:hypothetical protein